jgi:hypothetical protein
MDTPASVLAAYDALSPIPRVERPLAPHQLSVYVSNGAIGYWHGWTGFHDYREAFAAVKAMEGVGIKCRCPVAAFGTGRYL